MNTPHLPSAPKVPWSGRPARRQLVRWTVLVVAVHLGLLLGMADTLDWRLHTPQGVRTGPMQTRLLTPAATPEQTSSAKPAQAATAQTRIALQKKQEPTPKAATRPASPESPAGVAAETSASVAEAATAVPSAPVLAPALLPTSDSEHQRLPAPTEVAMPAAPNPSPEASAPAALVSPQAPAPLPVSADATAPAPERIATATMDLPKIALAALPPPALLSYRLNGQEKGLNYHATGELRWQHNDSAYAMSLSVKAFLVGSRHWRSQGQITSAGLAPTKFSDSWRSERAAHFDRTGNRIVFSSNAPTVALQAGAQDQISLYVQLAAAMAGSDQRLKPGTRLQIQTATIRDALPWLLTLDQIETLTVEGQALQTTKWVCQPRNRFDAKVEFWVAPEHGWLPVRIRITQVSGSFIDLHLSGHETLPPLPVVNTPS